VGTGCPLYENRAIANLYKIIFLYNRNMQAHTLPLHQFRAQLAQTLDRVLHGERIQITRHGVAVIELRALQQSGAAVTPLWKRALNPQPLANGGTTALTNPVLAERDAARY
jgi:antitoxin (DNA-binding transcriptional repressor) of toxin-antitoxin stability system